MGKNKSKIGSIFSVILQVLLGIGAFIMYAIINSLSEIDGGIQIATGIVLIFIIMSLYIFLITLLTKKSVETEVENYKEKKWNKKSKTWASILFVLIFIISAVSVETNLITSIISITLIALSVSMLFIPRIASLIIALYLLAEIVLAFSNGSIDLVTALSSLLIKGAYILLCIRVFLVANKLNDGIKIGIVSKNKEGQTLKDLYSTNQRNEYSYPQRSGINKVIIWGLSISLFILIWIGVFSLLGFRINKEYFTYDENICIADNWIGNKYHDGIDDCIYWARYNDLTAGRDLEQEWNTNKETLINCPSDCSTENFGKFFWDSCDFDPSVICNYSDYVDYIHFSNKDYLKSEKRDSFFEACVNKICKRPSFITVK